MSREQLTESQGQFDEGSPEAAAPAHALQLPLQVYNQAAQIRPGDVAGLQSLLAQHPDLTQAIAEVASHHAGMSTVKQAMRQPGAAPVSQEEFRPGGELALEGGPPASAPAAGGLDLQKDYRAGGASELESVDTAKPAKASEPAWVAGARHFNNAHMALVDQFNDLTDNKYALDQDNTNPEAIARWQREHGVAADGKIGPHTVAAARAARNNSVDVATTDTAPKADLTAV